MVPKKEKVAVGVTRHFLVFLLGMVSLNVFGQMVPDTTKNIRQSKVDALLSFYGQDGVHSAVTGGKGSEDLQVYSTGINTSFTSPKQNTFYLNLGVDVISSASTDSIDFEVSSASRVDQHTSISMGYVIQLNSEYSLGAMLLFSLESDYFSRGGELWIDYLRKDQRTSASLSFSAFFDDLRWGRLQPPYIIEARNLVYPVELRDSAWFDIYNRNSYNFSATYTYDLNKRMRLSVFPAYSYQEGLLSTPFHRVYFNDRILPVVENLPQSKHMGVLGVQLNSFVGGRMILRTYAQYYADNFGVQSSTLKVEAPLKLKPRLSLIPSLRYTHQKANKYFAPYREHTSSEEFYTSDYDLSGFWSINPGLSVNILTKRQAQQKWALGAFSLRYSYYYRQDGLYAHVISSYWNLQRAKELK